MRVVGQRRRHPVNALPVILVVTSLKPDATKAAKDCRVTATGWAATWARAAGDRRFGEGERDRRSAHERRPVGGTAAETGGRTSGAIASVRGCAQLGGPSKLAERDKPEGGRGRKARFTGGAGGNAKGPDRGTDPSDPVNGAGVDAAAKGARAVVSHRTLRAGPPGSKNALRSRSIIALSEPAAGTPVARSWREQHRRHARVPQGFGARASV